MGVSPKNFLWILAFGTNLLAQYNPHPSHIDYTENYRGQYHFSPKSEWMNDINGLVYQGGKYHMIYQWGDAVRHGGYATSPDLVHWKDEGVALIPKNTFLPKDKINVTGNEVYSGSAVVVKGETSKGITGSTAEAIIAIYTGTAKGTCLAWSNDTGKTWHDYAANPVAHFTTGADPRDPKVIWYSDPDKSNGDDSKWILIIYENGNTFYGSKNLINWTKLSNIAFGFECPDLFQLPLNGDSTQMKWVLHDASGAYLVGQFNGNNFIEDVGQKRFRLDVGPDFYAAQSFTAGTLPNNDRRIIQISWNDAWNGGIGETVWKRNATFPVELKLITHNGQSRITRMPIKEIATLYESTKSWPAQSIGANNTLLSAIKSKKFELSAEFDLNATTATRFGFRVANQSIEYDIAAKKLLGQDLLPTVNNRIKIHMLMDWGQFVVFGNDGLFSYSQQFAFTSQDSTLALTANGNVQLVSMEFHEIARIWGPLSKYSTMDDPVANYTGVWNAVTNDGVYLSQTAHYGNTAGDFFEQTFSGTSISWFGLKNLDLGFADVSIDGKLVADKIDCYSTSRRVEELFAKTNLAPGNHTIRVTVSGSKHPASTGTYLVHDYFTYSNVVPTQQLSAQALKPNTMAVQAYNGGLTIRFSQNGNYAISIFDFKGRKMAEQVLKKSYETRFSTHLFSTGIYWVQGKSEGQFWIQKVSWINGG